jgi:hypothetical protein
MTIDLYPDLPAVEVSVLNPGRRITTVSVSERRQDNGLSNFRLDFFVTQSVGKSSEGKFLQGSSNGPDSHRKTT